MSTVDIRNFTRSTAPKAPYEDIASSLLPGWEISLVFAGTIRAQKLNSALRNKEYIPNVLSYESGSPKPTKGLKRSGEIIICPVVAKKQAPSYGLSYKDFITFLFIHALLHLKGHPHGATMEKHERAALARFGLHTTSLHGTTNRNRN